MFSTKPPLKVASNQPVSRPSLAGTIIRAPRQKSPWKSSFLPASLEVGERPEMGTGNRAWGWGSSGSFDSELWVIPTLGNSDRVEPLDLGKVAAGKVPTMSHGCELGAPLAKRQTLVHTHRPV